MFNPYSSFNGYNGMESAFVSHSGNFQDNFLTIYNETQSQKFIPAQNKPEKPKTDLEYERLPKVRNIKKAEIQKEPKEAQPASRSFRHGGDHFRKIAKEMKKEKRNYLLIGNLEFS